MENRNVLVKNMYDSQVGVFDIATGVRLNWRKRGQSLPIAFETLKQLLYNDGFMRMLEQGILYIEDMAVKKELALEPQEATQPTNLIALTELQMQNLLTKAPVDVFKREISQLPDTQIDNIIDYAIIHKLVNAEKCQILKNVTGRDILTTISTMQQTEEAEKREREK